MAEGREGRGCGWCLQTQNTCGATTEDIRRRSAAAALALGFFSDESCWGPLQSGSHGCSHCWADTGSPCSPPLVPAISGLSSAGLSKCMDICMRYDCTDVSTSYSLKHCLNNKRQETRKCSLVRLVEEAIGHSDHGIMLGSQERE